MALYAVRKGRVPGIYKTWDECKHQIFQFPGAQYKKFNTKAECEGFIEGGSNIIPKFTPKQVQESCSSTPFDDGSNHPPTSGNNFHQSISKPSIPLPPSSRKPQISSRLDSVIQELQTKNCTHPPSPVLKIWTDGASRGNGKVGSSAGYGVFYSPQDPRNAAVPLLEGNQTNQRAELSAARHAITDIYNELMRNGKLTTKYIIVTDSQYTKNCFNEWVYGWMRNKWMSSSGSPVMNRDLIEPMVPLLAIVKQEYQTNGWGPFSIEHVRGHKGIYGNEMADQLANIAVDRKKQGVIRAKVMQSRSEV